MANDLTPRPKVRVDIYAQPRSTGRYYVTLFSQWSNGCAVKPVGVLNTTDLIRILAYNYAEDVKANGSGMA